MPWQCFLVAGINVKQPVHHLAADERLADDFLDVLNLHFVVENFVRQNRDQRSHLAKALAAAFVQAQIMRRLLGFEFSRDADARRRDLIVESRDDLVSAVRHAAGAGANDDAALGFPAIAGGRIQNKLSHSLRLFPGDDFFDEFHAAGGRHRAMHLVVHDHHRREAARAEARDRFHREQHVVGGDFSCRRA